MNIPVFQNNQMVEQSGKLTNEQQLWFDSLIQSMQAALSDNGWTVPTPVSYTHLIRISCSAL